MTLIIFTISYALTGLVLVIEKKEGMLDRSAVAGVHTIDIICAHISSKLAILTIQITCMLFISWFVFNIKFKGPIALATFLLLVQGFCGISYGIALSSVSNDESDVLLIGIGSVIPSIVITAIIWPIDGMSTILRYISFSTPLSLLGDAMRSVVSRGWLIMHPSVITGMCICLAWSVFFNIFAMLVFEF